MKSLGRWGRNISRTSSQELDVLLVTVGKVGRLKELVISKN